jgi:hypothetical protein
LYFLTKPARCAASASIELSTGMEFVDQISQPEMLGPRPRDTAVSFFIGDNDPLAEFVVSRDDPSNFQTHGNFSY